MKNIASAGKKKSNNRKRGKTNRLKAKLAAKDKRRRVRVSK
jgi:hypothetical protein